jgi:GntR family transcriptional regulator, histidine utilization repressor
MTYDQRRDTPAPQATGPDGPGEGTLHQRIFHAIEGQILSGAWPPGYKIPAETALAETYGCSRMTANKALSELARLGLIERRRKSGSTVRAPVSQSAVLEIHEIRAEVEGLELAYDYRRLARKRRLATAEDRDRLALPPRRPVLDLTCLHLAGGRPFCLEERLINLDCAPGAEEESFAETAPGAWLLTLVPWNAAEHTIRARAADAGIAEALGLSLGAPCLIVERRTFSQSATITHVRLIYPGDRHALTASFAPSQPKER